MLCELGHIYQEEEAEEESSKHFQKLLLPCFKYTGSFISFFYSRKVFP